MLRQIERGRKIGPEGRSLRTGLTRPPDMVFEFEPFDDGSQEPLAHAH
jgi:hypothetical protein